MTASGITDHQRCLDAGGDNGNRGGISHAYVLAGNYEESSSHQLYPAPPVYKTGKIVNGCVRVAAPDGFLQGGKQVVPVVAFIVKTNLPLHGLRHNFFGNVRIFRGKVQIIHDKSQSIQRNSAVSVGKVCKQVQGLLHRSRFAGSPDLFPYRSEPAAEAS